jgi:hypothetical protein
MPQGSRYRLGQIRSEERLCDGAEAMSRKRMRVGIGKQDHRRHGFGKGNGRWQVSLGGMVIQYDAIDVIGTASGVGQARKANDRVTLRLQGKLEGLSKIGVWGQYEKFRHDRRLRFCKYLG